MSIHSASLQLAYLAALTLSVAGSSIACIPGSQASAAGEQTAPAPRCATQHVVLVDVSQSVTAADVPRFDGLLDSVLDRGFVAGDCLLMLPIGSRSAEASALLERRTVPIDPDLGLSAFTAARKSVASLKREAKERLHQALSRRSSTGTDIFGALARVPAGSHLVILSDMLHSERGFDLERRRLRAAELPTLVERLARERRWAPDMLRDVRVRCYLTSTAVDDQRRPVNDRAILTDFWRMVFERMGATRLEHFDNIGS